MMGDQLLGATSRPVAYTAMTVLAVIQVGLAAIPLIVWLRYGFEAGVMAGFFITIVLLFELAKLVVRY